MSRASVQTVHGARDGASAYVRSGIQVRADLPAAGKALGAVAALGLPLGWVWSLLAPPQVVSVLASPVGDELLIRPLDGQSEQRFAAMGTFLLFGLAAGVLVGAALWMVRRRRGPVLVVAGVLGSMVAAWIAMHAGVSLANWYYPLGPFEPGAILVRPPVLESLWVVIAQPFAVAMTYAVGVAWDGTDDLGREV